MAGTSTAGRFLTTGEFSQRLKSSALASGREVDSVQDQRQLRTGDFQGRLFFAGLLGQLIGPLLQLLVPDAESRLTPVEDLDAIAAAVEKDKQASRQWILFRADSVKATRPWKLFRMSVGKR
jgi:hypothetical protein